MFERWGRVVRVKAEAINAEIVANADALLVRSVTRVDEALLRESTVRFVASATIGTDHVDRPWLASRGIQFAHAPGSNAESVVEYVIAALLALHAREGLSLRGRTIGVVGAGNIGARLAERAAGLGLEVLVCDPPLAEVDPQGGFVEMEELLAVSDVVTLHCPLTRTGSHPTFHLIDSEALSQMRPSAWLINASRGAVVDNEALLAALESGHVGAAVLDVWENEPAPDPRLIEICTIATPHIAGYSIDGKVRGTMMLAAAFAKWMGEDLDSASLEPPSPVGLEPLSWPASSRNEVELLHHLARQMYDIEKDDLAMRSLIDLPHIERSAAFLALRRDYPDRYSFTRYRVEHPPAEIRSSTRMALDALIPPV